MSYDSPPMPQEQIDNIMAKYSGRFHKKQYEQIADALCNIERGLHAKALHIKLHDELMEMFTAQVALMLAKDNSKFDSFEFHRAARKYATQKPELRVLPSVARYQDGPNT